MPRVGSIGKRIGTLAVLVAACLAGSCADPRPSSSSPDGSPVGNDLAPFEGTVKCRPPAEGDGAAFWDYGANPRGTIDDPVAWVREETIGLDPALALSFVEEFRGEEDSLDNVVFVKDDYGSVVGFIEFGRDDEGRYFPLYAEACASTGIEDFG